MNLETKCLLYKGSRLSITYNCVALHTSRAVSQKRTNLVPVGLGRCVELLLSRPLCHWFQNFKALCWYTLYSIRISRMLSRSRVLSVSLYNVAITVGQNLLMFVPKWSMNNCWKNSHVKCIFSSSLLTSVWLAVCLSLGIEIDRVFQG